MNSTLLVNENSSDSVAVHGDNSSTDFRVRLPRPYPLEGQWTVELSEFYNKYVKDTSDKELFVYSSMCDDSIVGEQQKPLLRRICLKDVNNVIFLRPYRIPFRTNDFNDVRIYIRDRNDKDVSFLAGETTVALVLKRL